MRSHARRFALSRGARREYGPFRKASIRHYLKPVGGSRGEYGAALKDSPGGNGYPWYAIRAIA